MTQDLNEIKKNPTHPFVDIGKLKMCAKFQQKILNCRVVGARQNFQFFRKTIELCLNFCMVFCIT